jgi:allantoicase
MTSIADEIEYKLDNVEVSTLRPEDIDKTFRSKCIGKSLVCPLIVKAY